MDGLSKFLGALILGGMFWGMIVGGCNGCDGTRSAIAGGGVGGLLVVGLVIRAVVVFFKSLS